MKHKTNLICPPENWSFVDTFSRSAAQVSSGHKWLLLRANVCECVRMCAKLWHTSPSADWLCRDYLKHLIKRSWHWDGSRPRLRILGQLEFLLKLSGKKITRVKSVARNLFEKHAWTIRRHKKTKYNSILLWPYVVVFNSIFRTFDIFAEYSKNIICRIYFKT